MDIDLSVLRSLEAEKDISMDLAIKAIEDALLVAYHQSEGAAASARVEVNRSSGHVTVWAAETAATATVTGNTTTRPTASGGSPRPPPGRSSCSGSATPRTSSPSASTRAARATSSPG